MLLVLLNELTVAEWLSLVYKASRAYWCSEGVALLTAHKKYNTQPGTTAVISGFALFIYFFLHRWFILFSFFLQNEDALRVYQTFSADMRDLAVYCWVKYHCDATTWPVQNEWSIGGYRHPRTYMIIMRVCYSAPVDGRQAVMTMLTVGCCCSTYACINKPNYSAFSSDVANDAERAVQAWIANG